MGEGKLKRTATQIFIDKFPQCCFCGGLRPATTREHMPPKALFDKSHRPNVLIMPACKECNNRTSTADAVASVLSRWRAMDMSEAEKADHLRLVEGIKKSHPKIAAEWNSLSLLDRLKAKRDFQRDGVVVPANAGLVRIGSLTIRQLNLFSHKMVLGLYFEHFRKPLPNTGRVCAYWRTKEDLPRGGVPPMLLEMMNQYGTLEQGKWKASEVFEYRFERNEKEGLFAFLARLRGSLYIAGFAIEDANAISQDDGPDWIIPSDLLQMLNDPRFERRH
jgi:hypothetical protein